MEKGKTQDQIREWLKKLAQESWQLELLVSAFTIFLLIQAARVFDEFYLQLAFEYDLSDSLALIYFFFTLIGYSIKSLTVFLIIHLLLRGFWIGSIGLRSVQSTVDYSKLNYSPFFEEKLKSRVINLDNLVMMLDEICSVIFSFSFLVISMLLSFALFQFFLWFIAIIFAAIIGLTTGVFSTILTVIFSIIALSISLAGLIYFIDYFTLGFFKKLKWFSKVYYPFYRLLSFVTLSVISRSIYYYLISKFSKKKIRIVYLIMGAILLTNWLIDYDQYQYFPDEDNDRIFDTNHYDNQRPADQYISKASISSQLVTDSYMQLFIRYDPRLNKDIAQMCPEFTPAKNNGVNLAVSFEFGGGNIQIKDRETVDDPQQLMECLSRLFVIKINDSIYAQQKYFFTNHPSKNQKGIMTMIPTEALPAGENSLVIERTEFTVADSSRIQVVHDQIPFWVTR